MTSRGGAERSGTSRRRFIQMAGAIAAGASLPSDFVRTSMAQGADKLLRVRIGSDISVLDPSQIFQIENQTVAGHLFNYSLPRAATAAAALFCCAERGNRQSCFVLRFFPATLENHRVVDTHQRSRNSIQPVSQSDRALVRRQRRSEASRRLLSILPKTRSPERTSTSRPPWR